MSEAIAYAIAGPDGTFGKLAIRRRELGPRDVLVEVAHVGICHSDIHLARDDWGRTRYPCVPGHEITGVVARIGRDVRRHRVGDRVGVGCLVDSCRTCAACLAGEQQYCARGPVMTYNSPVEESVQSGGHTLGGYATRIVVTEDFVLAIPDDLALDVAAPLLCAGVTVYSPLRQHDIGPGSEVAIVGMGGLGHLGVKIAAAMGARVTVLSRSTGKRHDSARFGAEEHHATADPRTFRLLRGRFDLILNTVSADLPVDDYLRLLTRGGALVVLGLLDRPMSVGGFVLAGNRTSLTGSMMGGLDRTREMLDFCAEHGIGPEIEPIEAAAIDTAYDRVVAGEVRYRYVIDATTM